MAAGLLVVIGPITTASRLVKKLNQNANISSRVVHTPDSISRGGCSYSVNIKRDNLPLVMEIANRYNIRIKAYYIVEKVGEKEVYHVIS